MKFLRALVVPICLALLASGCASTRPDAAGPSLSRQWQDALELSGRLSVHYQQGGERAINGNFDWRQTRERTVVSLNSPFGQTMARLQFDPGMAIFQRAGEAAVRASDVDQLAQQTLGWPLPVSDLRAWLQGYASENGQPVPADFNQPTVITSDSGWRIVYESWARTDQGHIYPQRLHLSRLTEQAGEVRLRMVVDQWQPLSSSAP